MGIQDDAAREFNDALVRRHFATTLGMGMTPWVKLTKHPHATVYFKVDHLGGLIVDLAIEGQRSERLNPVAGIDALADYLVDKVNSES